MFEPVEGREQFGLVSRMFHLRRGLRGFRRVILEGWARFRARTLGAIMASRLDGPRTRQRHQGGLAPGTPKPRGLLQPVSGAKPRFGASPIREIACRQEAKLLALGDGHRRIPQSQPTR